MTKKLLSGLMIGTMLSACTLMPGYKRPAMPVTENWAGEAGSPQAVDNEKLASQITWQSFFQSPSMRQVIQTTLDNNRDLRVAALNIESARELYRIQRADLVPELGAQTSVTRGNSSRSGTSNATSTSVPVTTGSKKPFTQYNAGLAITAYELDLFGRVRSLSKEALEDYLATTEAHNAAQISLIAETANAYLQWLADKKTLKLTNETLNAQQQSYDVIRQNNENGIGSRLDVAQAKTAVETAHVNQALYTRLAAQDENALVLLMGISDKSALPQDDRLEKITVVQDLPVGLPSQVLLLRPDIQQAEHNLKARNADIGAARANFFPTISLTGTFGFGSSSLNNLFKTGDSKTWNFTPQATLPIFTGGRNLALLGNSKVQREIAVAQYEKAVQSAFREVSDELVARETLGEQKKAQDSLVQATQESYDISNARYKEGIDSFLNVLDAQRSLYAAQQNAIDIERQRLTNLVNLYKVLGGGLASEIQANK